MLIPMSETSGGSCSPALSQVSVRTDRSMDLPRNLKGEKSDRSSSPTLSQGSIGSNQSMDSPSNLRGESDIPISEMATRLLDELKCSICEQLQMDPVCIPCGHTFCRQCIRSKWKPNQEGVYNCPQCSKAYSTCPELYIGGTMVKMIKWAGFSPALPAPSLAEPGDVACDFCSGRALKFCLTCSVNYCQNHLKPHYTVTVLQLHKLQEATGKLSKCPKHDEDLDMICKTDTSLLSSQYIEIVDSKEEPPTLSSNTESSLNSPSSVLKSHVQTSPMAGSTCPQMMTPPTEMTSGTLQSYCHNSDPRRPVKRRCHEDPKETPKKMRAAKKIDFHSPNGQEKAVTERSNSEPRLTEMLKIIVETRNTLRESDFKDCGES